ncbi:ankyrin repeat, SAM and basic leucine zipper domain-containing protein 1-like isoform X2 [Penaeus japonicus]|uniref:ankyrin repeat, SAM and basic leucine zipper domain-containing protein 1-like isoform X2 n=1 Tax=Penaeus japonicus TaxID=27405 RepID=UPI001C710077|nr:ankyrin repeat, SAM and basic leucine zipper domain-containing protein 1-like isoform X2 [Penaeus japonicus]
MYMYIKSGERAYLQQMSGIFIPTCCVEDQSLGSLSLPNGSEPNSLTVPDSPDKSDVIVNGHYNTLSPGYYNGYGYSKASSPAPSWCSRKSHSPAPSGSWRRHRMHEGYSLPLDEFRMAAMQGNLPVIKALVKQGIAVDQILKSGWTCLMYACSSGKQHIVEYLLQQNADPNLHKELFTPLMAACASSRESEFDLLQCVELLLTHGAKVDTAERHRMTALMFASKEGRASIVQRLINEKADVNKQDNKGWTALCWAATKGHGKVVRILLQHSADPLKMNTHGQRPADIALAAGYPEIADILERVCVRDSSDANLLFIKEEEDLDSTPRKPPSDNKIQNFGELEMVLSGLDLAYMIPLFQEQKVSFETFLRLTEKDLETMNVSAIGVRKKILQAVKEINKKEWQTSSLPALTLDTQLTVPEAAAMIANMNKHIRYMHASIGYLRDQLQGNPRLLQLGQEVHSVVSLARNCGDTLKYLSNFHEEVKFFKTHLDKVSGNAEYSSADLIVDYADNGRVWQRRLLASLVATTAIATILWYSRPQAFAKIFNISVVPQETVLLDV